MSRLADFPGHRGDYAHAIVGNGPFEPQIGASDEHHIEFHSHVLPDPPRHVGREAPLDTEQRDPQLRINRVQQRHMRLELGWDTDLKAARVQTNYLRCSHLFVGAMSGFDLGLVDVADD